MSYQPWQPWLMASLVLNFLYTFSSFACYYGLLWGHSVQARPSSEQYFGDTRGQKHIDKPKLYYPVRPNKECLLNCAKLFLSGWIVLSSSDQCRVGKFVLSFGNCCPWLLSVTIGMNSTMVSGLLLSPYIYVNIYKFIFKNVCNTRIYSREFPLLSLSFRLFVHNCVSYEQINIAILNVYYKRRDVVLFGCRGLYLH